MTETFVAQMVVADRSQYSARELAAAAKDWFGGPVGLLSVEISTHEVDGLVRYVVRGRFEAVTTVRRGRLETAAKWLGLVRDAPRDSIVC